MSYNEILANKVIQFIIRIVPKRQSEKEKPSRQQWVTLWQLIKLTMNSSELPLIERFEYQPFSQHHQTALSNLLTLKLQEDRAFANELETFLETWQEINFVEKVKKSHPKASLQKILRFPKHYGAAFFVDWRRKRLLS